MTDQPTPQTEAGPPEWLNVEYLASRGVTHPRSLELVAAAMDWGRDYGMFEVESLTDSLALIEAQARTEAPQTDDEPLTARDIHMFDAGRDEGRREARTEALDVDALAAAYDAYSWPSLPAGRTRTRDLAEFVVARLAVKADR